MPGLGLTPQALNSAPVALAPKGYPYAPPALARCTDRSPVIRTTNSAGNGVITAEESFWF